MPYKSEAQRRLFHWLAAQGKMPKSTVREYDVASKGKDLPEYVKGKAFGGQVEAKSGTHCPACDYPLDAAPVAMDAGEGCPRCGYGTAKEVPHRAHGGIMHAMPKSHSGRGGEVMDSTAYCARGGGIPQYDLGGSVSKPDKASTWTSAKQTARDREYFDKLMQIKDKHEKKWYDVYPQMLKAGAPEADVDAARRRIQAQEDRESESLLRQYPEQRGKQRRDEQLSQIKKDLATRGAIEGEMGPPAPPMTYAHGGAVCSKCGHDHKMARGGPVSHCARCGSMMAMGGYVPLKAGGGEVSSPAHAIMKELYPSRESAGEHLDDGKIRRFGKMFADAIKYRRG